MTVTILGRTHPDRKDDTRMEPLPDPADYARAAATDDFPFGDCDPPGGYREDDYVGLIYSDHEHYVFDNPCGFVREVSTDEYGSVRVTVAVDATVGIDRLFLIARRKDAAPAAWPSLAAGS